MTYFISSRFLENWQVTLSSMPCLVVRCLWPLSSFLNGPHLHWQLCFRLRSLHSVRFHLCQSARLGHARKEGFHNHIDHRDPKHWRSTGGRLAGRSAMDRFATHSQRRRHHGRCHDRARQHSQHIRTALRRRRFLRHLHGLVNRFV